MVPSLVVKYGINKTKRSVTSSLILTTFMYKVVSWVPELSVSQPVRVAGNILRQRNIRASNRTCNMACSITARARLRLPADRKLSSYSGHASTFQLRLESGMSSVLT